MSTSIDCTSSLNAAIMTYAPHPIATAATDIMQTLSPLIGNTGSSLDEDIKQSLVDVRERLLQAVRYMWMTIRHTLFGANMLCSLLAISDSSTSASSTVNGLRRSAESFLYGNACATDAYEQYKTLGREVESKFDLLARRFGEESVIDVAGKESTTKITLKTLRASITLHLQESEKVSSETVNILTGINNLLRTFLEDETFSLSKQITTAPLFSPDMFRTWKGLKDRFILFHNAVRDVMLTFDVGFSLDARQFSDELEADKEARKDKIPKIHIKLQIPENSADTSDCSTSPARERLISMAIPKTSGACTIFIDRSSEEAPVTGITGIRAIFTIPVPKKGSGLKRVYFYATARSTYSNSPPCTLRNKSTTVKQISQDPDFEPQNCKPILHTSQPSQSTLKWVLSRPFLRLGWKSAPILPTQLAISFDIEHRAHVDLQLNVAFEFRRRIFATSSHAVNAQVPVEPTFRTISELISAPGIVTSVLNKVESTDSGGEGQ
ncbi:hypothetical protein CVT24_008348 [Panaeolus cyanescens]|uniref:Uncharacterized protein n=1 Tax=Panaeolus cyanescens TaxID=181874 RepID=A0A409WWF2_9AGAR|nr:hypothetical protein CVT24_008348 [Panaeolus cyanescens]